LLFDVVDDVRKATDQTVAVESLDDLYGLADCLLATAARWDQSKS